MVSIFQRKDDYWLHANAKTTMGVLLAVAPTKYLPSNSSAIQLGEAVLELESDQERIVEHPSNWKDYIFPLLKPTKCASWSAFVRSQPLLVSVDRQNDNYIVEFHDFDGKGFAPTNPRSTMTILASGGTIALGQAVLALMHTKEGEQDAPSNGG